MALSGINLVLSYTGRGEHDRLQTTLLQVKALSHPGAVSQSMSTARSTRGSGSTPALWSWATAASRRARPSSPSHARRTGAPTTTPLRPVPAIRTGACRIAAAEQAVRCRTASSMTSGRCRRRSLPGSGSWGSAASCPRSRRARPFPDGSPRWATLLTPCRCGAGQRATCPPRAVPQRQHLQRCSRWRPTLLGVSNTTACLPTIVRPAAMRFQIDGAGLQVARRP